uniref:Uncharacterized protein n=1 Tax=Meloidogyne incognita TaxID=6306 RepID=A0A914NWE5_MELIC
MMGDDENNCGDDSDVFSLKSVVAWSVFGDIDIDFKHTSTPKSQSTENVNELIGKIFQKGKDYIFSIKLVCLKLKYLNRRRRGLQFGLQNLFIRVKELVISTNVAIRVMMLPYGLFCLYKFIMDFMETFGYSNGDLML